MAAHAPKHLSAHGKKVWHQLVDDYGLAREPHALELLRLALEQLDRAEEARQQVAKDGAYLPDRYGQLKAHPGIAVEKDAKTLAARLFRELALDPSAARRGRREAAAYEQHQPPGGRLVPFRQRRRPSRRELSLQAALALTIGPGANCPYSDRELKEEWLTHRERLLSRARPDTRPWGYWRHEDVPPELRATREESYIDVADGARQRLAERRRAWLLTGTTNTVDAKTSAK